MFIFAAAFLRLPLFSISSSSSASPFPPMTMPPASTSISSLGEKLLFCADMEHHPAFLSSSSRYKKLGPVA